MRVRIDDETFELADDPGFEQAATTAMRRHEVWQIHPPSGPVTVNWAAVTLLQVTAG